MSAHLDQIQAIHGMMLAGQRSVRLERHSLLLIGLVGGFISAATEYIINSERFPSLDERALALVLWLAFWLGGMTAADHALTRRIKRLRNESLPFAQAQVTRAWWMLLVVGTLGSCAMMFYGGGAMVYGLWIVLLGLGIYLFGLFSRPLVEWIGLATILLGVAGLAAGLPYGATHWLAASCFAIGMPLAAWLDARLSEATVVPRVLALLGWVVLVVAPALAVSSATVTSTPHAVAVNAGELVPAPGEQVLRLPAGTDLPLRLELDSELLQADPGAGLTLSLRLPVEVALEDGRPDGRYRIAEGPWRAIREGVLKLRIDRISPGLDAQRRPELRAHARLGYEGEAGGRP